MARYTEYRGGDNYRDFGYDDQGRSFDDFLILVAIVLAVLFFVLLGQQRKESNRIEAGLKEDRENLEDLKRRLGD